MKLIAANNINGVGYFEDQDKKLKYISFPYTQTFIRDVDENEISNAVNYFGFDKKSQLFDTLNQLVDELKKNQLQALKTSGIEDGLKDVEVDDMILYANAKSLLRLCDKVEYDLIAKNKIHKAKELLDLIRKSAEKNNFLELSPRIEQLYKILESTRAKCLYPETKLFVNILNEIGINQIWDICDSYSKHGNIFSSCR